MVLVFDLFLDFVGFISGGEVIAFSFIIIFIRSRKWYKKKFGGEAKKKRKETIVHERIHLHQQWETLVVLFPLLYFGFYIYWLIRLRNRYKAYMRIPFEIEAYKNEKDKEYLFFRPSYGWMKHV